MEQTLRSISRDLRKIEADLQKDAAPSDLSAIDAELASIDRKISLRWVPMRHSDLHYSIKSYIDVIRTRLGTRRAELQNRGTISE